MGIIDRYASAIRSSNLKSEEHEDFGDLEVVGAMGLADKWLSEPDREHHRPATPLAVPLTRLFLGDNHAAKEIVRILAEMAWRQARFLNVRMSRVEAEDLARACLAWHREGSCKPCGGHGVLKIPGSSTLGSTDCQACRGTGKMPFEKNIRPAEFREVAGWLVSEMERAGAKAGPAAMAKLAPTLDL